MIVPRNEFYKIMVEEGGIEDSLLFMPETDAYLNEDGKKPPSSWFVCCVPIDLNGPNGIAGYFFDWCSKNLKGYISCYYSSGTEEWWGFTEKDDLFFWMLKWYR